MSGTRSSWLEANRDHLAAEIGRVAALMTNSEGAQPKPPAPIKGKPFRIDLLSDRLSLTAFERELLIMAVAVELDGGLAASGIAPTAQVAFATLAEPHWSALSPDQSLRRWRLIEVQQGRPLIQAPLRVDPALLHWLTGTAERTSDVSREAASIEAGTLPGAHVELAEQLARRLRAGSPVPAFELDGGSRSDRLAVAQAAADRVGLTALLADGESLRDSARLWERDLLLAGIVPVIDPGDAPSPWLAPFVDSFSGPLFMVGRVGMTQRDLLRVELPPVSFRERAILWAGALHVDAGDPDLERLAWQFALSPAEIASAGAEAKAERGRRPIVERAWDQARRRTRRDAGPIVRRVISSVTLDDIVLPEAQRRSIDAIGAQVRHQAKVYGSWGMAGKSDRGLGITTLFSGPSGSGKTTAAEALAAQLNLDLLHIDLSQVVSKYIGETEKNIDRVFAAGEAGGAVLLFDEADAIFGKRSEVHDSHDRYANLEVSYLLQRMEAYRGLAILTTNQKSAIDDAFLRRIRFVVHFPFPDRRLREELWRRALPATLVAGSPDWAELSHLSLAGGSIRNIALNAAFNAAEAGRKIGPEHIRGAIGAEGAKLGAPQMMLQLARGRRRA
ncbi:ATP-binding protein [Sphingosinicella sp. CPCC 101087]|uniref:ATP-binding protein n=1 Tax=Sphingosinicella sp. CPCC 101087 TaxID=2497754 RepID=UPI00101E1E07|nr:ATP-binding protein [Sphingosinicella sp. CPCC 101087]